ncbi:MAG: uroporphyrinogen-III C-methyltransferase [Acidocella sp. 20-63-7]|nr:MAG: uroporphyrinogen-III C-methyltransferase [Acidocella sp. 20-63-7]HQT46837.1 uroporphyrinogen-III C-methyltransferase [Acidocella sp.]
MTHVFLVGAGPGDPELLTLKAARLLQSADTVLYDSLVDPGVLALAGSGTRRIDVGKRCGRHSASQAEICRLLVAEARSGRRVVRLKGGDPMIFGRATEEMDALRDQGIAFEVVPGVTAATAVAAGLQRSLTRRGTARSLHFLTGHGAQGGLPAHDWVSLTKSGGTLVVYMGGETLAGLATHFIEAGMPTDMPAILIENASLPDQRALRATISILPRLHGARAASGPVLILIGKALGEPQEVGELQALLHAAY